MVNTSLLAASLAALSAATTTSAFVHHVVRRSTTITTQLHATESFQRSLLEERLGGGIDASSSSSSSSTVLSTGEDEKFQRSLLQAKLAYDAIDAALQATTTPSRGVDDVDYDSPKPINPSQASGPLDHEIVVDDECYMGKDGQLDECADFGEKTDMNIHHVSCILRCVPYT